MGKNRHCCEKIPDRA